MPGRQLTITILLVLLALCSGSLFAQSGPPGTDIWIADLDLTGDQPLIGAARNITRRQGYDNQPAFSADSERVWYTRIDDDGVADIWFHERASNRNLAFTDTPTSEYSPTPTPNGGALSVVRVIDGKQWLYRLPLAGGEGINLLPGIEPVGYHTWLTADSLAVFVLGDPEHTLQTVRIGGQARVLASNIGRGLKRAPDGRVTFIDASTTPPTIAAADAVSGEIEPLTAVREASQDFAWAPGNRLFMGQGSELWVFESTSGLWFRVADLSGSGIDGITRLAISPDGAWLALVALDPATPVNK